MSRVVTIRLGNYLYKRAKLAAKADQRSLANFIECATLAFLNTEHFVTDEEMEDILSNQKLRKDLKTALADVKKGRYRFVQPLPHC